MRLTNIRLKGLTCFPDEVSLDLDAIGPGLVAVVGANGQGKTTLLEAVAAALYLELPSRPGSLYSRAHGKDAYVEASFDPGDVRAAVKINADHRLTEAYLTEGPEALTTGRTREFQEAVQARFGSRESFLASVFAAQNAAGSFLKASKADRKALFVELLGLGRLQELSEDAREEVRGAESELAGLRGQLVSVEAAAEGLPGLFERRADWKVDISNGEIFVEDAKKRHLEAVRCSEQQSGLREKAQVLSVACGVTKRAADAAQRALTSAQKAPRAAKDRAEVALGRLDDALPQAFRDRAVERHLAALESVLKAGREKSAAERRSYDQQVLSLSKGASLLGTVPCRMMPLALTCRLLASAREAHDELHALRYVEPDLDAYGAESRVFAEQEYKRDLEEADAKEAELKTARASITSMGHQDVEIAEAAVAGARAGDDEAHAAWNAAMDELAVAEAAIDGWESPRVGEFAGALKLAESKLQAALVEASRNEAAVEKAEEAERQALKVRAEAYAAETALSEWGILEKALGRDGVQALEIDAAGPAVAGIANELLESCYGPRFSLSFETLREKKSKKGEYVEAFDIQVYDEGVLRTVEDLSGGEKVIVGEALGLALALFNSKQSGVKWATLWRDETAGALDPANAQRYVDMLRRARELGGFHQVIFVSHSEQVWERADARVTVESGQVSVA